MPKNSKFFLKAIISPLVFGSSLLVLGSSTPRIVFSAGCADEKIMGFCAFVAGASPWACGIIFSGDYCLGEPGVGCAGQHACLCAWGIGRDECNSVNFRCTTGKCPDEPGYEGSMCLLADENSGINVGECFREKEGYWDPDERMCVTCSGPIQNKKVADMKERCYACTAENTWTGLGCENNISHTCETACDPSVPPQCDEKLPGSPGCDANCHGISLCGNGQLDPGEQCDPGPPAQDAACPGQCQANCTCAAGPCKTGPSYYTCQNIGINCSICPEELQGGLVPCGRMCDDPCTIECECAPCTLCHLFVLAKRVIDFLTLNVLFPLAVLMIVIGGVMFLTAAGNPGRIETSKKILTSVVIGLLIIFLAWLIVDTIIMFMTKSGSPFQNWKTINCPVP